MKLNNKGFALTSIVYMLIVLFLLLLLLILSNLATRKVVLDKLKYDVKTRFGQGGVVVKSPDLPYLNITTGLYYETLQDAFNGVSEGVENVIKVMKNVDDISTPELAEGKIVKIDLNGNDISLSHEFTNRGSVDVYSSVDNGKIYSSSLISIYNYGTFTLNGTSSDHSLSVINDSKSREGISALLYNLAGNAVLNDNVTLTYNSKSESGSYNRYISLNAANIVVNGATLINNVDETDNEYGISNYEDGVNGSIVVNSGLINTSGISLESSSTKNTVEDPGIKVTGGLIKSSGNNAIYNVSGSMVYITGGEIYSTGSSTINNTGDLNMTGGIVRAYQGIAIFTNKTGNVFVSGGQITKEKNPVTNAWKGNATFQIGNSANATITGNAVLYNEVGNSSNVIYNAGNGTLTIDGAAYIENKDAKIVGTNHGSGKIVINSGTIKSAGGVVILNDGTNAILDIVGGTLTTTGSIAIQNTGTSAITTIGIDDGGAPSTTVPSITGKKYGIQSTAGTLNFYDGVVVGKNGSGSAISGTVNTPSLYNVQRDLSGTTETAYLKGDYVVKVDPNGGVYNDSTSISSYAANSGTIMSLGNPTRSGYTFGGWLPTKDAYDATWVEVFYHNNRTGTVLFSNAENWKEAMSTDGVDKFSILGQLEKFRTNTSQVFEFLLEYDEVSGKYNRWQQTANPVTTTVANGTGSENAPGYTTDFTGSHIDWTGNYWGGLTRSTNGQTFINGSVGHVNWFYAVGARAIWGGNNTGIPGPNSTNINGAMHLWVKANDDLSNITQQVTGVVLNDTYIVKHDITLKAIWIPN